MTAGEKDKMKKEKKWKNYWFFSLTTNPMRDACVKWQQKESFIYVFPFSFFLCVFLSFFLSFILSIFLSVCLLLFFSFFFRFNVFYYIIFFSFLVFNSYSVCYVFLFSVFLFVPLCLHVFNAVTYVSFGWRAEIFLRSKIFSYQVPNYTILYPQTFAMVRNYWFSSRLYMIGLIDRMRYYVYVQQHQKIFTT